MKNKTELRKLNKALTIADMVLKNAKVGFDLISTGVHQCVVINTEAKNSAIVMSVSRIPSECWRTDRPKLDARRYRRHLRGFHVISR